MLCLTSKDLQAFIGYPNQTLRVPFHHHLENEAVNLKDADGSQLPSPLLGKKIQGRCKLAAQSIEGRSKSDVFLLGSGNV